MISRNFIDSIMKLTCLVIILAVLEIHGNMKFGIPNLILLVIGLIWVFTPMYDLIKDVKRGKDE
jgi:hypothetical protein